MKMKKFVKKWTPYNHLVTWMCFMTFACTSVNLTCFACVLLESMYVHTHTNVYFLCFNAMMMTKYDSQHNIAWIKICFKKKMKKKTEQIASEPWMTLSVYQRVHPMKLTSFSWLSLTLLFMLRCRSCDEQNLAVCLSKFFFSSCKKQMIYNCIQNSQFNSHHIFNVSFKHNKQCFASPWPQIKKSTVQTSVKSILTFVDSIQNVTLGILSNNVQKNSFHSAPSP